jgi:hypothetical protein
VQGFGCGAQDDACGEVGGEALLEDGEQDQIAATIWRALGR